MIAFRIVDRCIACSACLDECEKNAIQAGDVYRIDPNACGGCGACADVCPVDAVKRYLVEDFVAIAS